MIATQLSLLHLRAAAGSPNYQDTDTGGNIAVCTRVEICHDLLPPNCQRTMPTNRSLTTTFRRLTRLWASAKPAGLLGGLETAIELATGGVCVAFRCSRRQGECYCRGPRSSSNWPRNFLICPFPPPDRPPTSSLTPCPASISENTVETTGIEPATPGLQSRCSPS